MKNLRHTISFRLSVLFLLLISATVQAQTYFPIDSVDNGLFEAFPADGATLQNYDCLNANPCYWFNSGGQSVAIVFTSPQDQPTIRVWGMNDDDIGALMVNGAGYSLSASTAEYSEKVICSTIYGSPGPNGILFEAGNLIGANTNNEGNWAYQDLTLLTSGVESITVSSLGGAGWGVSGVLSDISSGLGEDQPLALVTIYPNPFSDRLVIDAPLHEQVEVYIHDLQGQVVLQDRIVNATTYALGHLSSGVYVMELVTASSSRTERLIKY